MKTVILLTISNVFMTFAWYGHLTKPQFKTAPLWAVVIASWGIAFFEYCFQVPANRIGHNEGFTAAKLKIIQEVITLAVFVAFSLAFLPHEKLAWNHWVAFALVLGAVFFVHHKW